MNNYQHYSQFVINQLKQKMVELFQDGVFFGFSKINPEIGIKEPESESYKRLFWPSPRDYKEFKAVFKVSKDWGDEGWFFVCDRHDNLLYSIHQSIVVLGEYEIVFNWEAVTNVTNA